MKNVKLISFSAGILIVALCAGIFANADAAYKITDYASLKSPNQEIKAEIVHKNNSKFDSVIFTHKNNQNQIVDLENIVYTSIDHASWIDDTRFAIEGHINPSLNVYMVADAKNGTLTGEYYGLGFTWNKNKNKLYYIQTSPHFSSIEESDKIVDSDSNIYFETEPGTTIADKLSISEDEKTFEFFVMDDVNGQSTLYITKLNKNNKLEKQSEIDASVGEININSDAIELVDPNGAAINF